jgi:hypothetical protein
METMSVHEFIKTVSTPEGFVRILILGIVGLLVSLPPVVRILRRTGYSGWWAIIGLMHPLSLVGLWVFAYAEWPAVKERQN